MAAIKYKRFLIAGLLVLTGIGCAVIFRRSESSTFYKGKTIDQWLEETTKAETEAIATRTLREAGELALPDLIRALTRSETFFFKNVAPRLPGPLRSFVPQDKRSILQEHALQIIDNGRLRAHVLAPLLKTAIPRCDDKNLFRIGTLLIIMTQSDNSALNEVAKLIPDLREALNKRSERSRYEADWFKRLEILVQVSDQLQSWVPIGTSLEDVSRIMEEHHFDRSLKIRDRPVDVVGPKVLDYHPRPGQTLGGTNRIDGPYIEIGCSRNKVSSIRVKPLFQEE